MNTKRRIDQYAQSMFRFEHLNESWIESCARYLRRVFGERLAGRVVIDYAFGRGNWAIAFLAAGAGRVIAIDAAVSNVSKLADYCRDHDIDRVEVIEGDILEGPLACRADFLWVYGV